MNYFVLICGILDSVIGRRHFNTRSAVNRPNSLPESSRSINKEEFRDAGEYTNKVLNQQRLGQSERKYIQKDSSQVGKAII